MAPKVWLITGASSGFGRILTEIVLANGDICIATSIDPPALAYLFPKFGKERLRLLHTDVTQLDDVVLAFNIAEQTYGHIDVVFNNAGVGLACEVESTPRELARNVFEVNFWGSANVAVEAVRFFREVNGPERGGKLLQMTSMLGIGGWPALGYYSASKHALEGLTKTLVQELNPAWNIQIMLIEPDFMRTPIFPGGRTHRIDPLLAYVGGAADQARDAMEPDQIMGNPQKAMELVHQVAQMDRLPLHLPVGPGAVHQFRATGQELMKAADDWEELAKKTVFKD